MEDFKCECCGKSLDFETDVVILKDELSKKLFNKILQPLQDEFVCGECVETRLDRKIIVDDLKRIDGDLIMTNELYACNHGIELTEHDKINTLEYYGISSDIQLN
jgi:hypothetical protein